MKQIPRRRFLASAGVVAAGAAAGKALGQPGAGGGQPAGEPAVARNWSAHRGPCVIASGNGLEAVKRAYEVMMGGADPVDAVVAGVTLVEDDPNDNSVGLGGLPNEEGVVQLDASVMHGPTHKAGAVACLEGIRNPSQVALLVLKTTDHVLLVGEGAKRFALRHGFKEENLLTEESRLAWLRWKSSLSPTDDWLNPEQMDFEVAALNRPADRQGDGGGGAIAGREGHPVYAGYPVPWTTGTINCSAVNAEGNLASVTTTSGLSWKIPGRVGDSPIVGAGMYCDNEVGAAGSTGRGEAVITNCGGHAIVREMESGKTPTEACLAVARRIAARCVLEKRNRDERGRPNFNVSLYAVRKDGAYGAACLLPGGSFAVRDSRGARVEACVPVFES